jgi:hypothetical protein
MDDATMNPGPRALDDATVPQGLRALDDAAADQDPRALSALLMTREPAYMARWLALQVLMTDEVVQGDEELFGRLSDLQEQWQEETLGGYGAAPQSGAGPESRSPEGRSSGP